MENLCFSGGGVKGYAYIGILKYLEEIKALKDIKSYSCTSIGSVFAILMLCGYTSSELENIVYNIDLSYIENVNVSNLFTDYGLDDMKRFCIMLGMFLVKKKIKKDITLLEFYKHTQKTLYITCTDLNDYSQKVFNHIETPDVKLIDACRYACTIPFVFTVNKDNMYVDGCFSKNLPIELLPIENTIGFYFETNKKYTTISTLKDYVLKTVGCMLNRSNAFEQKLYIEKGYKIIDIPCYLNALDYKSEKDIIEKQILSGYISIFKATTA